MELFAFINSRISVKTWGGNNSYVDHPDFASLYVRVTSHTLPEGTGYRRVKTIDIANITARQPGKGAFKRLVAELRERYPMRGIYVESVLVQRFAEGLTRMGFITVAVDPGCYYLPPAPHPFKGPEEVVVTPMTFVGKLVDK